jgi:hypothetical protein
MHWNYSKLLRRRLAFRCARSMAPSGESRQSGPKARRMNLEGGAALNGHSDMSLVLPHDDGRRRGGGGGSGWARAAGCVARYFPLTPLNVHYACYDGRCRTSVACR